MNKLWRNYTRSYLDIETELLVYINKADTEGDGHIFHHKYKNRNGQLVDQLTEYNT